MNQLGLIFVAGVFLAFATVGVLDAFAANSVRVDQSHYEKGNIISISGVVEEFPNTEIEVFISNSQYDNGGYGFNKLWVEKLVTKDNGKFSTLVIAGSGDNWIPSELMRVIVMLPNGERATDDFSFGNPEEFEPIVLKDPIILQNDDETFELRTQTENLEIIDVVINSERNSINFDVNMLKPQGIFEVWLDTNLIDAKSGNLDEDFIILVDGNEKKYAEIFYREDNLRVVSVWLNGDVNTIEIIGTQLGNNNKSGTTEATNQTVDISEEKTKLPEWVRNIFIWYAEGNIGEDDLIGALEFLINEGIIKVKS